MGQPRPLPYLRLRPSSLALRVTCSNIPTPPLLERLSVRSIPKPASMGDPYSGWPKPFRDLVTANPFAVLTPPNDAPMDGAMSWEPDSIDAAADGFVQAV
jgi:hypothetical protein